MNSISESNQNPILDSTRGLQSCLPRGRAVHVLYHYQGRPRQGFATLCFPYVEAAGEKLGSKRLWRIVS